MSRFWVVFRVLFGWAMVAALIFDTVAAIHLLRQHPAAVKVPITQRLVIEVRTPQPGVVTVKPSTGPDAPNTEYVVTTPLPTAAGTTGATGPAGLPGEPGRPATPTTAPTTTTTETTVRPAPPTPTTTTTTTRPCLLAVAMIRVGCL